MQIIVTCYLDFPIEMSDKISHEMTSALLAMSLSYYYAMGEHVKKEARMDEILSTLFNCSKGKTLSSIEPMKGNHVVFSMYT